MKTLVSLFILLLAGVMLHAQNTLPDPKIPFDAETNTVEFSKVVHVKGTKDELFNRCVYWLNNYYKSPTRVTQIRDLPSGKILGKHLFYLYTLDTTDNVKKKTAKVNYTFTVVFKEGRYKWEINDLEVIAGRKVPIKEMLNKSDTMYRKKWKSYLIQINDFVTNWSKSLENKMLPEQAKKEEEDDW